MRERRGKKLDDTVIDREGIFEAKIFSGTNACKFGLTDSIGEMRSTMKDLLGENVVFKEVSGRKKLSQRLGLSSSVSLRIVEYLEEIIAFSKFGL